MRGFSDDVMHKVVSSGSSRCSGNNVWVVVAVCRDSVQMFCQCLEWQWVKLETVSSTACLAHRNLLVHGVTNMSGMV